MANKACSSSTKVLKRQRKAAAGNNLCTGGGRGGEVDRISNLPVELLGCILSCFPTTKEAICTSVLSKQWRHVWTSVPCIDINDGPLLKEIKNPRFKARFVDFVHRVLRLNEASRLQKCSLVCAGKYRRRFVEWVSALTTTRSIEELSLENLAGKRDSLVTQPRIELPPCIFTCQLLVILKLKHLFVLNAPVSTCLPKLKTLHLVSVTFCDEHSLKNLLAGCPVLEEFDMEKEDLYIDDNVLKTLHVNSSSLKSFRLVVKRWYKDNLSGFLLLNTKNLERLDLSVHDTEIFDINSLPNLVSVKLDLSPYKKHHLDDDKSKDGGDDDFVGILSKMCNTKCLQLSNYSMKCLQFTNLDNLPMFHNLTHLVVKMLASSWPVLPYLIECSPNLITFDFSLVTIGLLKRTIGLLKDDVADEVEFRMPKCSMIHLESIRIEGFRWSKNEMEMVRYFLKSCTALKEMVIYVETLPEQSNLCCKELLVLVSTTCRLKLGSDDLSLHKELPLLIEQTRKSVWEDKMLLRKVSKEISKEV